MTTYIGLDGDKVGARLEAYIIAGDVQGAAELSKKVSQAVGRLEKLIEEHGGQVIFAGADSVLAMTSDHFGRQECEQLAQVFLDITGCTASIGIGRKPVEAYLALKLAKARNSGSVVTFIESPDSHPKDLEAQ